MTQAIYTDAQAAVKAFINSRTGDLVGPGMPLAGGAHVHRRAHGSRATSYAWLTLVGGGLAFGAESPDYRARVSAAIYGHTNEAAAAAALAYANVLAQIDGKPVAAGTATLLFVDNITGPLEHPDIDEPRYIVDADFFLRA